MTVKVGTELTVEFSEEAGEKPLEFRRLGKFIFCLYTHVDPYTGELERFAKLDQKQTSGIKESTMFPIVFINKELSFSSPFLQTSIDSTYFTDEFFIIDLDVDITVTADRSIWKKYNLPRGMQVHIVPVPNIEHTFVLAIPVPQSDLISEISDQVELNAKEVLKSFDKDPELISLSEINPGDIIGIRHGGVKVAEYFVEIEGSDDALQEHRLFVRWPCAGIRNLRLLEGDGHITFELVKRADSTAAKKLENTKQSSVDLAVGKAYVDRSGNRVHITRSAPNPDTGKPFIFYDDEGRWFLPNGRLNDTLDTPHDLVDEIIWFNLQDGSYYWIRYDYSFEIIRITGKRKPGEYDVLMIGNPMSFILGDNREDHVTLDILDIMRVIKNPNGSEVDEPLTVVDIDR